MIANSWRFKSGHRIKIFITSDDQNDEIPTMMNFRHASVGTSCLSTISAASKLLLPIRNSQDFN